VLCAGLAIYPPAALTRLDSGVYDTLLRSTGPEPPLGRIVIVDIDDRSVARVGQWPWRRDVIARLIARLRDLGARTIALDIIFAEPDRNQRPPDAATPGTSVDDAATAPTASDARLAETIRGAHVVVGHAFRFESAAGGSPRCLLHPLRAMIVQREGDAGDLPLFTATGALCSLPILAEAAGASGFLNAAPDLDGILRRAPLVLAFNGRTYPALALAALMGDTETAELRVVNANTVSLAIADRTIPLDGRGNLLLRYRGAKRTFPYVAAADVLDGQAPLDAFRGSIVFVGATALGVQEFVATPHDSLFPGVEVQATLADNLLRGDFLRRPENSVLLQLLMVLGVSLGMALVIGRAGVRWGTVAAVAVLALLWGASAWLLASRGVYLSPLLPVTGVVVSVVALSSIALAADVRAALTLLQRARRDAESAAQAKSEFLMTVSHELRTPLSVVYGYVQMLAKGVLKGEQKERALASVERNARAQTQLIDDLLVASQSASGKLRLDVKALDLGEVVRSVVDNARSAIDAKRITLHAAIDDHVGLVVGDRDRLQQVVWNLVSNAIKFTPDRGRVEVRLERVKSSAVITVGDSGAGIADEFLPHVFEHFQQQDSSQTREHGGLGLGLAVSRHIVELHGGKIDVDGGGDGRGATFRVRLPLNRASAVAAMTDDAAAEGGRLTGSRILVVDDHAEARAAAASALLQAGAHVVTAASRHDALALLQDGAVDVLVVSLDMPNDDGARLSQEAQTLRSTDPERFSIVALGGSPSNERLTHVPPSGIERHLAKPVQPEELVAAVAALASDRSGSGRPS
jgi:signal transduction histidine kinase/ActR/RegA family two-component response regulator